MVRRIAGILLISLLILAGLPLGVKAQENEPPAYAARGPYAVGTLERVVENAERPLAVTVWYPALNPDNLPEEVTYWAEPLPIMAEPLPIYGHALPDAAPHTANGPYPLVIGGRRCDFRRAA